MKSFILLTFLAFLSAIRPSKGECCSVPIKCVNGSATYRCYDCTESTVYCGYGKCNILGCNCDGGCRQGDSTLWCWNIVSGCNLRSFYYEGIATNNANQVFAVIDANGDGRVSYDEAFSFLSDNQLVPKENIEKAFAELDTNGDRWLSVNEIDQ